MTRFSEQRFLRIISGEERSTFATAARISLAAVEPFYRAAVALRNKLFDIGWRRVHRLNRRVISVGNLTTGGTGKTPMVLWLANELLAKGRRPAILMRGYKSRSGRSDEADEYHRALGDRVEVVANPDRVAAGRAMLDRRSNIDVFLLDDGFQHRRLHREVDIVLIDATRPFGFDHVLPRGLLREAVSGLRRANVVVITRCERVTSVVIESLGEQIARIHPEAKIFTARTVLRSFRPLTAAATVDISPRRAMVFCAIGNPGAFAALLRDAGMDIAAQQFFADHHAYTPEDIESIEQAARQADATLLLTTGKDATKLVNLKFSMPVMIARSAVVVDDANLLVTLLMKQMSS